MSLTSKLIRGFLSTKTNLQNLRNISTTKHLRETFTIQDEEDFKAKVRKSPIPVIVEFSATWCGPCKILGPRLEAAVANTESKVNLAIVDIDELDYLALDHEVKAVPTVVAYKDGKVVDKFVGLLDDDQLDAFISKLYS